MIYFLTTILFILGVGFHVTSIIEKLRKKFPEFGLKEIVDTYFKEEWNTLIRSFLVLSTYELALFIIHMAQAKMPPWWDKYLVPYVLAIVLGYCGQRIIYKYLSTAEGVLERKAENINQINQP